MNHNNPHQFLCLNLSYFQCSVTSVSIYVTVYAVAICIAIIRVCCWVLMRLLRIRLLVMCFLVLVSLVFMLYCLYGFVSAMLSCSCHYCHLFINIHFIILIFTHSASYLGILFLPCIHSLIYFISVVVLFVVASSTLFQSVNFCFSYISLSHV